MAVLQAQYPSSSIAAAFRVNNNNNNNDVSSSLGNFHQDHHQYLIQYAGHQVVLIKNGTSTDPEMMTSELTCNFVSASTTTTTRKRKQFNSSRGVDNDQMPHQQQHYHLINPQLQQVLLHQENVSTSHNYNCNYYFPAAHASSCRSTKLPPNNKLDQQLISTHDQVCVKKSVVEEKENRLNQSGAAGTSTSGQTTTTTRRSSRYHDDDDDDEDAVLLSVSSPQLVVQHSQHHHHLTSSNSNYLLHQNLDDDDEIDALIQLQHQTLRSVVEQTQQKQCRLLMSVLEHQVQRRLKEKQTELENAWGRQAELQEKVKQMSSDNQMWFNVAKNNEAMVLSLRSTLEHHQLLLHLRHQKKMNQNRTMKKAILGRLVVEEGFGDNNSSTNDHGVLADDAQSSNFNNNNNNCHQQLQVNVGEREYKTVTSSNVDVRDHDNDDASMMMMMREHQQQHKQQQQQQQQHRKMCKVCKMMEVSVLLLPCRHLCLCKDCEAKLQACPICNSFKNASLQIFMS